MMQGIAALLALSAVLPAALAQPIDSWYSPAPAVWTGAGYTWGSNTSNLRTPAAGKNPATNATVARTGAWRTGDGFVTYAPGFSSGVASGDPLPGQIMLWTRFSHPADAASLKAATDPTNTAYAYNTVRPAGYLPVNVSWWLGASASGASPMLSGVYTTDGSRDWSVKLDVSYSAAAPAAGTRLYFGFSAPYGSNTYGSPVGSFKAMTTATAAQLDYAVVSCSNWGFGLFNAYDMLAQLDTPLDVYVHAGDTIYEYADLNYPTETEKIRPLVTDPASEIATLDDYRRRHRLYRTDPSLQKLGSRVPLIMIPDDHEYANNAWMTGAENHQPFGSDGAGFDQTLYIEGDWYLRMNAALQAMFEYMPLRGESAPVCSTTGCVGSAAADAAALAAAGASISAPGSPATNVTSASRVRLAALRRSFTLNGLVTMTLLEDRVSARTSANAVNNNGMKLPLSAFDCPSYGLTTVGDPQCSPVAQAALASGLASVGADGVSFLSPVNWTVPMITALKTAYQSMTTSPIYYGNTSQHLVGTSAVSFLNSTFAASKAAGVPYQVFVSQTVFQTTAAPDLLSAVTSGRLTSKSMAGAAGAICSPSGLAAACAGAKAGIPWNTDSWDGFDVERNAVLAAFGSAATPIINSGDAHGFWLGGVPAPATVGSTTNVAVEFAGGSVTSQGWGDFFAFLNGYAIPAPAPGGRLNQGSNAFVNMLEDGFVIANNATGMVASRHLHGALVFRVTATSYIGQVFTIDTMASSNYTIMCDYAYSVPAGTKGVMNNLAASGSPGCVSTVGGAVPGTFNGLTGVNGGAAVMALSPPAASMFPTPTGSATGSFTVSAAVTLQGLTAAQFTATAQTAFIATLAVQLSVLPSAITITGVTAASAGRHLLQTGITVAFVVNAPSPVAAGSLTNSISAITTGAGATAFVTALNTNLVAAGAPAVTGIALATAPTVANAPTSAAPAKAPAVALAVAVAALSAVFSL